MRKIEKRIDPWSGKSFKPSKSNQLFSEKAHRVRYNNEKAKALRHSLLEVNTKLHNNIIILNKIMTDKQKATFDNAYLIGMGYSFETITSSMNRNGKTFSILYQYRLSHQNNKTQIFKMK